MRKLPNYNQTRQDWPPAFIRMFILMLQVLSGGVPTHEDGQEGDARGGDPGQADHHHGSPHCDSKVILQGLGYCEVPEVSFFKKR